MKAAALRSPLVLEVNKAKVQDETDLGCGVFVCDHTLPWIARVRLTDKQAIVAFPKFGTVGIGFEIEDASWNTNLPHSKDAEALYAHIACNRGRERCITKEACLAAIRLLQPYAASWLASKGES